MIFRAFEAIVLGAVIGFGLLIFLETTWELYKISKSQGKEGNNSLTAYNKPYNNKYNKFIYYCVGIFIRK